MAIEISQEESILGSEEEMLGAAAHFRADVKALFVFSCLWGAFIYFST